MINIYDYETLGTDLNTAPVVNVAAMTVDEDMFLSDTPYSYMDLVGLAKIMKFDVKEQVEKYGRIVDKNTLAWWQKQGEAAMSQLKPLSTDVSITELPAFLRATMTPGQLVYTRGNTFDPVLTTSICNLLDASEPYRFWDVRDTRTMIEGIAIGHGININNSFVPKGVNDGDFIAHNPAHDIAMDIFRIQQLLRGVFYNEPF